MVNIMLISTQMYKTQTCHTLVLYAHAQVHDSKKQKALFLKKTNSNCSGYKNVTSILMTAWTVICYFACHLEL